MPNISQLDKRLEALMRRKAEVADALRAQRERKKDAERRFNDRLALILGRVVIAHAARVPDLEVMMKDLLRSSIKKGTSEYNLLEEAGWMA